MSIKQATLRKRIAVLLAIGLLFAGCSSAATETAAPEETTAPDETAAPEETTAPDETAAPDETTAPEEEAPEMERIEVRMIVPTSFGTAPIFVANDLGFWRDRGLDVRLTTMTSGSEIASAMQAGEAEIGGISLASSIPPARAAGNLLTAINVYGGDPLYVDKISRMGIYAHEESGIDPSDPATLVGKSIAITEGSTGERYALAYLADVGIDPTDVELVNMPAPEIRIALEQKLVDAGSAWEPFGSDIMINVAGAFEVVRGGTYAADTVGLAVSDSYLDDPQADTVIEIINLGIMEAAQYIRQNPEESAEIAINYVTGIDLDVAAEALLHHDYDPRVSVCTELGVTSAVETSVEAGSFEITGDVADFVDGVMSLDILKSLQASDEGAAYTDDLEPLPTEESACK